MKNQTYRMTMLFDFYGETLTERQKEFFDLYYNEDLSLGEIAENYGISRQGVRDVIVRAEASMQEIEDKTGLIRRFMQMQPKIAAIEEAAQKIKTLNYRQYENPQLEALAAERGVELEYIPIAYDAMVFFTNAENSVTGLTRQQIQDIYVRNAYDNWSQVGGPDAALLPYCRNTDSGSHALMERYFLEDGALSLSPDILQGNVSISMSSALTDVAAALSLDPPAYAIGYSVYAYYDVYEELMADVTPNKLKLLAIDGVQPTDETIADGTYPLAGYNYVVLRADEPENSPARRLAEYMVSAAGQQVVSNAGFLPLAD